jgi:cytochrome c oxidase subunit 3
MPSTFTHIPAETERREPGTGGKPPVDRRPTGGGGGGGDDDWKNGRHGPRELLYRVRFYVFLGLTGDMMFFAVLAGLFFARQSEALMATHAHEMVGNWHPVLLPHLLYLNTAVLLLSSLTMELARENIFREIDVLEEWLGLGRPALRRSLPWVAATLALGALFLAGQGLAWKQVAAQELALNQGWTPAGYFFYVITGLHAAHLAIGMAALIFCLTALGWLRRVEYRQIAVDSAAWFWHAMSLVWLLLLAVLASGQ